MKLVWWKRFDRYDAVIVATGLIGILLILLLG